ncbi:hypothetical protein LCL95_04340 [Bacillus timonensis]|nr:hypothetical protein [Bacillus timonensis]
MNKVGKYASQDEVDEIELMKMVFDLSEKDRMLMWSEGYIDIVINRLPSFAKDILEHRKRKWEVNKQWLMKEIDEVVSSKEYQWWSKQPKKDFAKFIIEKYADTQSLLFRAVKRPLTDRDYRKFLYFKRFSYSKRTFLNHLK